MWLLGFCEAASLAREWRHQGAPGPSGAAQPRPGQRRRHPRQRPQRHPIPPCRTRCCRDATVPDAMVPRRGRPGRNGASIARATPAGPWTVNSQSSQQRSLG